MTALAAACSLVTACGGGGGDGGDSPQPPTGPTGYAMVRPTTGTTSVYAVTSVDDLGTTVQTSYRDVVQSVASDGSYTLHRDDPTNSGGTVDGVNIMQPPAVLGFTAAGRQATVQVDGGSPLCTFVPQDAGEALPLTIGETFTDTVAENCDSSIAATFATSGSVVDSESITVAAGTFAALKLAYTITRDGPQGSHAVTTGTKWVDPAHSFFTIKDVSTTTQLPSVYYPHYVTSSTIELQSRTY